MQPVCTGEIFENLILICFGVFINTSYSVNVAVASFIEREYLLFCYCVGASVWKSSNYSSRRLYKWWFSFCLFVHFQLFFTCAHYLVMMRARLIWQLDTIFQDSSLLWHKCYFPASFLVFCCVLSRVCCVCFSWQVELCEAVKNYSPPANVFFHATVHIILTN